MSDAHRRKGLICVFLAACFFSLSTPLAKPLVGTISPFLLAGLFYFGSGLGAAILAVFAPKRMKYDEISLKKDDAIWMLGSIIFGAILAPPLVLIGLRSIPASDASLLLNFEMVFTILVAWVVFHEQLNRKFAVGAFAVFMGSVFITWNGFETISNLGGTLAIVVACFCWGFDNNFIRKISVRNPFQVAGLRGMAAGLVNLLLSLLFSAPWAIQWVFVGLMIGIFCYGFSNVLWVLALRYLGGARAAAYYSSAPFIGAVFSILLLHDSVTIFLVGASVSMGLGVIALSTERSSK